MHHTAAHLQRRSGHFLPPIGIGAWAIAFLPPQNSPVLGRWTPFLLSPKEKRKGKGGSRKSIAKGNNKRLKKPLQWQT